MSAGADSLPALQRAFQAYLLARDESFAASVRDTGKATRATLLDVYRDGYALRLIEAMTSDYPGLMAMAGPADFDHMARAYIAAHPSRHPSVRWFGRGLADFLAATPPFSNTPAAAEMAHFEWLLGEAFDARDAEPVAADAVMALPADAWETLAFKPVPSLLRLVLAFEVPQAWQRREDVEAGNLEVTLAPRPVPWVIWRPESMTRFRSLDLDEAAMLDGLVGGRPFPELCEGLVDHVGDDQATARAAGLLRIWIEEGLIASFSA